MKKQRTPDTRTWPLMALIIGVSACGGSNEPSTMNVTTGAAGTSANAGTAGAATTGTAGTSAAGSVGASGGAGANGAAGASGAAGAASGGAGAMAAGSFSPNCAAVPVTAAGMAPAKAGACAASDTQLCYKTCGPQSLGFKSETCTNGAYVEQSGCAFPTGMDYSCYKVPTAVDASCPAMPPQASQPCTVAACTLCDVGGSYLDSTGASKPGYCVCPAAAVAGAVRKWSCASGTAWPCPAGQGC
jgi:hypothetical protein